MGSTRNNWMCHENGSWLYHNHLKQEGHVSFVRTAGSMAHLFLSHNGESYLPADIRKKDISISISRENGSRLRVPTDWWFQQRWQKTKSVPKKSFNAAWLWVANWLRTADTIKQPGGIVWCGMGRRWQSPLVQNVTEWIVKRKTQCKTKELRNQKHTRRRTKK